MDCGAFPKKPGCPVAGHDARREHVHCRGDRLPDQTDCAISTRTEPGEFPGPDARLPEFGGHGTCGLDHQDRQPDGALPVGPGDPTRPTSRWQHAGLVSADQTAAWLEDCTRGSDATNGHDHVADAEYRPTVAARKNQLGDAVANRRTWTRKLAAVQVAPKPGQRC